MSQQTIADLRKHLFATLDGLTDKANPMDIERAKAVSDIAQTIINSAKVEVEHLKVTGQTNGTGFLATPALEDKPTRAERKLPPAETVEERAGVRVVRHTLR